MFIGNFIIKVYMIVIYGLMNGWYEVYKMSKQIFINNVINICISYSDMVN